MTIAERLAEIVVAPIEPRVAQLGVAALVDTFGVMLAGSREASFLAAWSAYRGAETHGPATVIGQGRATAETAALCNGIAGHSVELDDFHRGSMTHPGTVVVPAALAVAEETGASGRALLESVVVGYEVTIRVGLAMRGALYSRGFHPTGVAGVMGAAAAAARLLGADRARAAEAIGLAATRAAGLLVYKIDGDWSKRGQAGAAASGGIASARLACAGFRGPRAAIEGRYGLLQAYVGGGDGEEAVRDLSSRWHMTGMTVKPYPSCRFNHAPIDALLAALAGRDIDPASIERIDVKTHAQAIASVMVPPERKYAPVTSVDAQFSLPYCLAVVAVRGRIVPDDFALPALADPAVLRVAAGVRASAADEFTRRFPDHHGAEVVVTSGARSFSATVTDAYGDPERPLSDAQLDRKFLDLAAASLGTGRSERLLELLRGITGESDLSRLSVSLRTGATIETAA
jgi:2-methylcitrate dehydratase PrpD